MTWLTSLPSHPQPPPPPPPTTLVLQHQHPCHPHPQSVVCVHGLAAAVNKSTWDKMSIPCIVEEPIARQLPPPLHQRRSVDRRPGRPGRSGRPAMNAHPGRPAVIGRPGRPPMIGRSGRPAMIARPRRQESISNRGSRWINTRNERDSSQILINVSKTA